MEDKNTLFTKWMECCSEKFFIWALYKTSSQETAEDLVQDTFLAAFQPWGKFNHDSSPKTGLYAILNNKIGDYFWTKARNVVVTESELLQEDGSFFDFFLIETAVGKKRGRNTGKQSTKDTQAAWRRSVVPRIAREDLPCF